MQSFNAWCPVARPGACLQTRLCMPCMPDGSTLAPQRQLCTFPRSIPRRRATATRTRIIIIVCHTPNLVVVFTCVNHVPNLRKIGQKIAVAIVDEMFVRTDRHTDTQTYAQLILVSVQCHELHWTDKNVKFVEKRAWPRSRDLLLNFGTPSISL